MSKRETEEHASRFELAQAGRKLIRSHSEFTLKIAVSLRPLEQSFHDE